MQICMDYIRVLSCNKDKHDSFYKCQKSNLETKHDNSDNDKLSFREVLNREIYKRK